MRERDRYLPWPRGTGCKPRQGLLDRRKRGPGSIAVAEVDDEEDADKADVDLHEHAAIVIVVRKRRGALPTEVVGDRLPGLAQARDFGGSPLLAAALQHGQGEVVLIQR